MISDMFLILGSLGVILSAGGAVALALESYRTRPRYWQLITLLAAIFAAAFISEPPAAWGNNEPLTALRSFVTGAFIAVMSRMYISEVEHE